MSDTQIVSDQSIPLAGATERVGKPALFLFTWSEQPCGVETFTRTLVAALVAGNPNAACELHSVSGRWRDLPATLRRVAQADQVVFGFPLVAWKRKLLIPFLLLLFACATRRRIGTFLHEWTGMHWLRRLVLIPYVLLSQTIVVLSPFVLAQIAGDPLIARVARKCRLVPHPPTVQRPSHLMVTDTVRAVERAAQDADIVIGYFGAIYGSKAPTALLDICDHLRGRGIRALIVYVGSFIASVDGYEARFRAQVKRMGLEDQVIVTGYVATPDELFAVFERIGVFLFLFPEGLTARRSSVIACLQSNKPVVVTAPRSPDEFRHHAGLTRLIEDGAVSFVPRSAGVAEIADRLMAAVERTSDRQSAIDGDAWWRATTEATRTALLERAPLQSTRK